MLILYQSAVIILGFIIYTITQQLSELQSKCQKLVTEKKELEKLLGKYPPFEMIVQFVQNFDNWLHEHVPTEIIQISNLNEHKTMKRFQSMVTPDLNLDVNQSLLSNRKEALKKQWMSFGDGEVDDDEKQWWKLIELVEDLKMAYINNEHAPSDQRHVETAPTQDSEIVKEALVEAEEQQKDLQDADKLLPMDSTPLTSDSLKQLNQKPDSSQLPTSGSILPQMPVHGSNEPNANFESVDALFQGGFGDQQSKFPEVKFSEGLDISNALMGDFVGQPVVPGGVGAWLGNYVDVGQVTDQHVMDSEKVQLGHAGHDESHSQGEMSSQTWTTAAPTEMIELFDRINKQYDLEQSAVQPIEESFRINSTPIPQHPQLLATPNDTTHSTSFNWGGTENNNQKLNQAPTLGADLGNFMVEELEGEGEGGGLNFFGQQQQQTQEEGRVNFLGGVEQAQEEEEKQDGHSTKQKTFGQAITFGADFGNESVKEIEQEIQDVDDDKKQKNQQKSLGPAPSFAGLGHANAKKFGAAPTFGASFGNATMFGFESSFNQQKQEERQQLILQEKDKNLETKVGLDLIHEHANENEEDQNDQNAHAGEIKKDQNDQNVGANEIKEDQKDQNANDIRKDQNEQNVHVNEIKKDQNDQNVHTNEIEKDQNEQKAQNVFVDNSNQKDLQNEIQFGVTPALGMTAEIENASIKKFGAAPTFGADFGNESAKWFGQNSEQDNIVSQNQQNQNNIISQNQQNQNSEDQSEKAGILEVGPETVVQSPSLVQETQTEGISQTISATETETEKQSDVILPTEEIPGITLQINVQEGAVDEEQKNAAEKKHIPGKDSLKLGLDYHAEVDEIAIHTTHEQPEKKTVVQEVEPLELDEDAPEYKGRHKKSLGAMAFRVRAKLHKMGQRAKLKKDMSENVPAPPTPPPPSKKFGSIPSPPTLPPQSLHPEDSTKVAVGAPPARVKKPPPRGGMPPPPPGRRGKPAVQKYEYRKFHWIGVKKINGTIFEGLQKIPEGTKDTIKDCLWMRFIRPKAPEKAKSRTALFLEEQANRPKVLDQGHMFKIELLMEHCPDFKDLREYIHTLQPGTLSLVQTRTLLKLQPTDKELAQIEDNIKKFGIDLIFRSEVFYHELNKIPFLATRLKFIEVKLVHEEEAPELKGWLKLVSGAIVDVKDSDKFRRLLALVLSMGNLLRPKSQRERGFMMSDLTKLRDTKSFKGKCTLLHVVVHTLMKHDPEVVNMLDDWDALLHCKEQQLSNLLTTIGTLEEGKTFLQGAVADEHFLQSGGFSSESAVEFKQLVDEDCDSIKKSYQEVRTSLVELCKYLAIKIESDFDGRQPDALFHHTLFVFGRMMQFASKEKEKLQALEQYDENYAFLDFEKDE